MIEKYLNKIICGLALEELKKIPDESINCVVTSPPYWALRDYGVSGQLGLETTFQEYINKLCDIFDEVKRVLKKDGTCFVVIGDTYAGGNLCNGQPKDWKSLSTNNKEKYNSDNFNNFIKQRNKLCSVTSKCLIQIPARFAIEMTNRDWILRNTIIWHKPNCMPSSAEDRFTVNFEYVFFFVKNKKYWFEQQKDNLNSICTRKRSSVFMTVGRNKRCVWRICPKPFKEAHFAVYPEKLIEPMIKAGCPKFVCKKCGKAREKIFENKTTFHSGSGKSGKKPLGKWRKGQQENSGSYDIRMGPKIKRIEKGYTDCGCNTGFEGGITLDPFMGSGTTALVSLKLDRNFIGIELSPKYVKMARKRIKPFLLQFLLQKKLF